MGKSPQEASAARQVTVADGMTELDPLEQTVSLEGARVMRHDAHGLIPEPIPPLARGRRLIRNLLATLKATFRR